MQIKILPQYLQSGKLLGYKASVIYKTKKIVSYSFKSHTDANNRLFSALFRYIDTFEGTNKLNSFKTSPLNALQAYQKEILQYNPK